MPLCFQMRALRSINYTLAIFPHSGLLLTNSLLPLGNSSLSLMVSETLDTFVLILPIPKQHMMTINHKYNTTIT